MTTGMNIKGLQAVQRALKKEVDKLKSPHHALVGIHQSAGSVDDGTMTVATLGVIQHFGNDRIPERPWLDKGFESGVKEVLSAVREGIEKGFDSRRIAAIAGEEATIAIQEYVNDLQSPPNKPSTVRKKGSSNPLVDTGNMRNSITYTVVRKKSKEGLE